MCHRQKSASADATQNWSKTGSSSCIDGFDYLHCSRSQIISIFPSLASTRWQFYLINCRFLSHNSCQQSTTVSPSRSIKGLNLRASGLEVTGDVDLSVHVPLFCGIETHHSAWSSHLFRGEDDVWQVENWLEMPHCSSRGNRRMYINPLTPPPQDTMKRFVS